MADESRKQLQEHLMTLTPNVYYQPPKNILMKYPCIIYRKSEVETYYADNKVFMCRTIYAVTIIDTDPDMPTLYKVLESTALYFNPGTAYIVDGLHHMGGTITYRGN